MASSHKNNLILFKLQKIGYTSCKSNLLVKELPSMILLVETSNFPSVFEHPAIIQKQNNEIIYVENNTKVQIYMEYL